MTIYEALALNRLLPRLSVGGGTVSRDTRIKLIDLRNRLNALQRDAETYRNDTLQQCDGGEEGIKLAEETLNAYIIKEASIHFQPIPAEEIEQIADNNALRMDEYELLRRLVEQEH